jgi:dTDP-4-amino-4,6-dideoxygalactose transaminase
MIPIAKPFIGDEEKAAVMAVLESGVLAQGQAVADLEQCFAELCGTKYAIATTSGTTALHVALLAHEIGPGDEVITTPFTFIASPNSILFTGAKPVFVDIEPDTFNIDAAQAAKAVTPRTKAILPVHLYGQMCDMTALQAIADQHGLAIIEDSAQAVGATYQGRRAGSFGTGTFSLYATKNVMSGEGGMITTNDDAIAERCRLLRNHGMQRRYYYEMLGYNFRMSNLHAAVGLAQMDRWADFTAKRQANAAYLNEHISSVVTPSVQPGREHVWHQYTVRLTLAQQAERGFDRDTAVTRLNSAGIGTAVFYPIPAHKHGYMRGIVGDIHLPVTEKVSQEVFSLPVHPQLSQDDLARIVVEVNKL